MESIRHCQDEKGLEVYGWCLMSNHAHMIMGTNDKPLEGILRDIKKYTSVRITAAIKANGQESRREWMIWMFSRAGKKNANNKSYQFWQQDNHPVELSTNEMMEQKLDYIHNNPVEAGLVLSPEEYLYSSAKNYAGQKEYLLEVKFIE